MPMSMKGNLLRAARAGQKAREEMGDEAEEALANRIRDNVEAFLCRLRPCFEAGGRWSYQSVEQSGQKAELQRAASELIGDVGDTFKGLSVSTRRQAFLGGVAEANLARSAQGLPVDDVMDLLRAPAHVFDVNVGGKLVRVTREAHQRFSVEIAGKRVEISEAYNPDQPRHPAGSGDVVGDAERDGGKFAPKDGEGAGSTESAEFKAWFEGSQVTDEDGKPRIVYHGTGASLTEFRSPELPSRSTLIMDIGIHFAESPKIASRYAAAAGTGYDEEGGAYLNRLSHGERGDAAVYPVYLRVTNPLIVQRGRDLPEALVRDLRSAASARAMKLSRVDPILMLEAFQRKNGPIALRNLLERHGYDGASYYWNASTNWVVFSPEQVKSIFNRGTWDPKSPKLSEAGVEIVGHRKLDEPPDLKPEGKRLVARVLVTEPDGRVWVIDLPSLEESFDPEKHPRHPAGTEDVVGDAKRDGGKFAPKDGEADPAQDKAHFMPTVMARLDATRKRSTDEDEATMMVTQTTGSWLYVNPDHLGDDLIREFMTLLPDYAARFTPERFRNILKNSMAEAEQFGNGKLLLLFDKFLYEKGLIADPPPTGARGTPLTSDTGAYDDIPDVIGRAEALMIHRIDREFGVAALPDGKTLTFRGGNRFLPLTPGEREAMKDAVFTHNHPSPWGLSEGDVQVAATTGMREIRAVTMSSDGTAWVYRWRFTHDDIRPSWDEINTWRERVTDDLRITLDSAFREKKITSEQANDQFYDGIWRGVAKQLPGVEYSRHKLKIGPADGPSKFNDRDILEGILRGR